MILAAILGASLSIFSRESLPRFSNWQSLAAMQLAERRSPSSTAISPNARPLRSVAMVTGWPSGPAFCTATWPVWMMHMKLPASPSRKIASPAAMALMLK
ncbi:hypothetical protein D9M68_1000870 [compost metagenome]